MYIISIYLCMLDVVVVSKLKVGCMPIVFAHKKYEKSQIFIKINASSNLWWADKIRAFSNFKADFEVEIFTLSSWKWFLLKNIKLDAQLLVKGFVILQNFIKLYLMKLCLNFAGSPQVCTCINLDEKLGFFIFYEGKNNRHIANP